MNLSSTACSVNDSVMMGQTLTVTAGEMVKITIKVHDPLGANNCPLNMTNPSLDQIGVSQLLSETSP